MASCAQQLRSTDYERRLNFVAFMIVEFENDPDYLSKILSTDEAKFHDNGVVNHHNNHFWSNSNPHWINETNSQVRWGINVWCGITDTHLIGPYFFQD